MDLSFVHTKFRSLFGRQTLFSDRGPEILDSILPNKRDFDAYILKDPVDNATQVSSVLAEHVVNTDRVEATNSGMNHSEGGWPKDINYQDPEQTVRYKRKVEKEESYNRIVSDLCRDMEHCILQNNAVNIYQKYFEECEPAVVVEPCSSRTVNVYRDQTPNKRPGNHLSWSPDGGTKLAVSHCFTKFQGARKESPTDCYIWDIENPNVPLLVFKPTIPMVNLEYNQKDPNSLVSGMTTGQVAAWDTRKGPEPVEISLRENSHREPVSATLWINSKSGTEFFTASCDGAVKWWDTRRLDKPTEFLVIDTVKPDEQDMSRALGISALEYEPTIPTRYMMGTDQGFIVGGNRKGKLPSEKILYKFQAHPGPIYSLMRNPAFVKNILTVGEWTAKIWSEDCKESAIIWTSPQRHILTAGAWSPVKYSAFFVTRYDGTLDIWDIMNTQREPTLSIKVCDVPLRCLRIHEQGRFIAAANDNGTAYLIEVSQNLCTNQRNDKPMLTAMFDRETRREKILEGRIREIKLKLKAEAKEVEPEEPEAPGPAPAPPPPPAPPAEPGAEGAEAEEGEQPAEEAEPEAPPAEEPGELGGTEAEEGEAEEESKVAASAEETRSEQEVLEVASDESVKLTTVESAEDPSIKQAEVEYFQMIEKERLSRMPKVPEPIEEEPTEWGGEEYEGESEVDSEPERTRFAEPAEEPKPKVGIEAEPSEEEALEEEDEEGGEGLEREDEAEA